MALNKIKNNASWGESASSLNSNFESIEADLTKVKNATTRCKGYFISGDELKTAYPSAHVGDYAYIGTAYPFYIWKWNGSSWGNTGNTGGDQDVNLENYYNKTETDAKFSELSSKVLSIPPMQSSLYKDVKAIDITPLSLPIVDNNGNVLSVRDTLGWMTVEKGKLYHVIGDVNLSNGQSIIVSWSATPSSDTYIDNYNSYLTEGSYHIDTVIESKNVRLTTSNGLSVYECTKVTDEIEKRTDEIEEKLTEGILYERTFEASGDTAKFLTIPYNFKNGVGYCLELTDVVANSNIRLFTTDRTGLGYNDCVQYIEDVEPKDNLIYFYCNADAEYLYVQVIETIDTTVSFKAVLKSDGLITKIAKNAYLIKLEKSVFTNESIGRLIEKGYKLGDLVSLNQDTNTASYENGQIRPASKKQWGAILSKTDYYLSGTANIDRAENLLALFNGGASIDTYIDDFGSYAQKGTYNISFVFNSGDASRVLISNGLTLRPLIGLKSQEEKPLMEKVVIDHLVTPTGGQSETSWRGVFTLIPKGSKITEYSYIPIAVGSAICSVWKYDDTEKTMQKMEEFTITSTSVGTKTYISELQGRVLGYDAFVLFKKNGSESSAIGWANDNTGAQLAIPFSNGDSFSVKDNNLAGNIGNLCVKVVYESDYFNNDSTIIEVGKGKAFESLSLAALAASCGDTLLVDSGTYKNNNIQSWGKKIHIIGKSKYSCTLECDTSDYSNPPVEMNVGSISNMTIIETCENPTVTETDKTSGDFDRLNMAYTIHIESGIMAANEKLYIDNCILKNKHRPCIGAGLYQDFGIVMKNTQCHSGKGFVNPSSGGNGCRGALYFHTKSDDSNTTGQTFYAENCVFECDDEKYATINGYYNNTMEVTFIGNTFWSGTKGKSEEGLIHNVGIGGDSIISLSGKSNGNNVGLLNHE